MESHVVVTFPFVLRDPDWIAKRAGFGGSIRGVVMVRDGNGIAAVALIHHNLNSKLRCCLTNYSAEMSNLFCILGEYIAEISFFSKQRTKFESFEQFFYTDIVYSHCKQLCSVGYRIILKSYRIV